MSIIDKEKASTSFNAINTTKSLEDAERRYVELFEVEKQRMRKKEQESKEIIQKISKKLKVSENWRATKSYLNGVDTREKVK